MARDFPSLFSLSCGLLANTANTVLDSDPNFLQHTLSQLDPVEDVREAAYQETVRCIFASIKSTRVPKDPELLARRLCRFLRLLSHAEPCFATHAVFNCLLPPNPAPPLRHALPSLTNLRALTITNIPPTMDPALLPAALSSLSSPLEALTLGFQQSGASPALESLALNRTVRTSLLFLDLAAHEADFFAGAGKALAFKRLATLQLRDPLRTPLQLRVSEALIDGLAAAAKLARLKEVFIPRPPPSGPSSKALGALRKGVEKLVVGGAMSDMYRGAAGGAAEFIARHYCLTDSGQHGYTVHYTRDVRDGTLLPQGSRLPVRAADLTPDGSLLLEACSWGQEGVTRVYNLISALEGSTPAPLEAQHSAVPQEGGLFTEGSRLLLPSKTEEHSWFHTADDLSMIRFTLEVEWDSCLETRRMLSQVRRGARGADGPIRNSCAYKQFWEWSWEDMVKGIRHIHPAAPPSRPAPPASRGSASAAAAVDGQGNNRAGARGASLVGVKRPNNGPGES